MSYHHPVEGIVGWAVPGFAGLLRAYGPCHLGGLSTMSLPEYRQQDHASTRRQPVRDPRLLSQQMKT
jgi:hypothetical protein